MRTGRYFAGAGLLVLPFILSLQGEQMRAPKARFLVLLAALYLAQILWKKVHPALGCAIAVFSVSSLFMAPTFAWEEFAVFMAAMTSCLWARGLTEDQIGKGLEFLELSGLVCAFYGAVLQYQGLDPLLRAIPGHTLTNPPVFFGQHTLYGPFAVACFASALFHGRHIRAALLATPLILIYSSFTFLALGVVLFLFALRHFGRYAVFGFVAAALLFFAYSKINPDAEVLNDNGRFRVWSLVKRVADRHAIVGHGANSFRVIFPILQSRELRAANGIKPDEAQTQEARDWFRDADFVRDQWGVFLHPHSEPLSVYFEFGLIGLILALWWVTAGVFSCFEPWLDAWFEARAFSEPVRTIYDPGNVHWTLAAIFLSSLANSLGNFNFHLIPQALLPLWAFAAMTTRKEGGILEA